MTERLLCLDRNVPPKRNVRGGYDFKADCGLQQFVVETSGQITDGLSETMAQARLLTLRPQIERAARLRREEGDANPESFRPGELLFRIALTFEDLIGQQRK